MASFDWTKIKPDDGWFAKLDYRPNEVVLYMALQVSGRVQLNQIVESTSDSDALKIGRMKRKLIILEAVAEYLNAGGDPSELENIIPKGSEVGCIWAEGWHYFDGGIESSSGNRVHEFTNESCDSFVRWVRHDFIDTNLTLEEISDDSILPTRSSECFDSKDF